jgi:hypothetical protein
VPIAGWVFLGVFVLLVVGGAVFVISSDRKRSPFQVADAELRAAPPVVIDSPPMDPLDLASAAIFRVGGGNVTTSEDRSRVVGWTGNTFTNIPSRQEYELLIDIRSSMARYEFRCMARPRFSSSLGGAKRAGDLAEKLRGALEEGGTTPLAT